MKKCPIIDGPVLYPECMECEYHKEKDCREAFLRDKEKSYGKITANKEESRESS